MVCVGLTVKEVFVALVAGEILGELAVVNGAHRDPVDAHETRALVLRLSVEGIGDFEREAARVSCHELDICAPFVDMEPSLAV